MKTKEELRRFWDIRSKTFPGHREGETYQAKMLEVAKKLGVDFHNKSVLDLGSGSGAYTLRIAKEAKSVTALDISPLMLDRILEDAKAMGINNISTVSADWLEYNSPEKFDIIFCSLTPAIGSPEAVDKVNEYKGALVINIEFVTSMKADLMEDLYRSHGVERSPLKRFKVMRTWLEERGVPFVSERVQGEWTTLRDYDETIANAVNIIEANSATPNMDIINKTIEKYRRDDGLYEYHTYYDVEMILWNVK